MWLTNLETNCQKFKKYPQNRKRNGITKQMQLTKCYEQFAFFSKIEGCKEMIPRNLLLLYALAYVNGLKTFVNFYIRKQHDSTYRLEEV